MRQALAELEKRLFREQVVASFERLRGSEKDWREYLQEGERLDRLASDGLPPLADEEFPGW